MLRRVTFPSAIQAFDEAILAVALRTPRALVVVFLGITTAGGGWGLLALLPFAIRRVTRAATLWLFGAAAITSVVVSLLKALVGRARPCDALPWCSALAQGSPGGPSFPSGHAAGSFAFAAFVATRSPRLAPLVFPFAALVAWSRCVLGVHYPSDVAIGALIGSLLGAGVGIASRGHARSAGRSRDAEARSPE
jgi:undecaprenyl-diphosphatase